MNPFLDPHGNSRLVLRLNLRLNLIPRILLSSGRGKLQIRISYFFSSYGLRHGMPLSYRSSVAFWAHSKELLCSKSSSLDHIFSGDLGGSSTRIVLLVITWALLGMHRPTSLVRIMTLLKDIRLLELGILHTKRRKRNCSYRGLEPTSHMYEEKWEELVILICAMDNLTKYSFQVSNRNINELWPEGEK